MPTTAIEEPTRTKLLSERDAPTDTSSTMAKEDANRANDLIDTDDPIAT
jgi:hypothetical protein